jgi:hypothetical protein
MIGRSGLLCHSMGEYARCRGASPEVAVMMLGGSAAHSLFR